MFFCISEELSISLIAFFISNTDKRISKAKNLLSSITGEFNLVDEPEEEEVV